MSNIVIQVNGSGVSDAFLVAPDGDVTFAVPLSISTSDGSTVTATIDATPNGAGINTLPGGNVTISPKPTVIQIFATAASGARGDTIINVHSGGGTTSFKLTAISNPQIWFKGRFEVRFATDNDWYNDPKGTWGAINEGVNPLSFGSQGPGYTFWLEGEPLFTPQGVDSHGVPLSVPTTTDKPVGRVLRFNNPVAPRSHVAAVVTVVDGIRGALSNSALVYFTNGDPVIGAAVNVGPNTYLAQNWEPMPGDPMPAESQAGGATFEPMALFEFHIAGFFDGKPASDSDRPKSTGFQGAVDDPSAPIGTVSAIPSFANFVNQRLMDLQNEYAALPAADIPSLDGSGRVITSSGSMNGRNLKRRIDFMTGANGRPQSYQAAWDGQEEYENGQVNNSISVTPGNSPVMSYFAGYTSFGYYNKLHGFHSDELCGYVYGSLTANQSAPIAKTCTLQLQNSTFGKDQLTSLGLPGMKVTFPGAFWVVLDGFFPSELGIDANDNLTNPPNPPSVTFSVDGSNANAAAITTALVTNKQLTILPFTGQVLTVAVPPAEAPQRILYPFSLQFSGLDGFIDQTETLTLTATIKVNGKSYQASAPLVLTLAANPYVMDADAGNQYTSWLSTDLRVFAVDDNQTFFGKKVSDFYPAGAVAAQYPVTAAAASTAATGYIADLIQRLTPTGAAGGDSFEHSLTELEAVGNDLLEYLQVNPRTNRAAFNFAICRVRIRGTTPPNTPPPFTTQAQGCRVFFRAFQAQTTVSTFDKTTTYRSTPIGTPDITPRVPLLGVQADSSGNEVVTIPFFAVDRVNLNGPADLTTQPPDMPNFQTISPQTGMEVDTYYGCWLDMNQPTSLFPQFVKSGDFDNKTGYFNTPGFQTQSINAAFTRAPHQCLIAEIAFDDIPIPNNADSSTSDKLAQRNLAYIDGPNPGISDSRRMPHPFQIKASAPGMPHVDELMFVWGNTPSGSHASIYLPGVSASDVLALAKNLYIYHTLTMTDPNTISTPIEGPVTFVPIPRGTGFLASLLTIDLPAGIKDGDLYKIVVRQLTDARSALRSQTPPPVPRIAIAKAQAKLTLENRSRAKLLEWRRVLGAFQVNLKISTKQKLLPPEVSRLSLFRWIAGNVLPQSRWYPVIQRYILQLAGRVAGFGGDPSTIPPSQTGWPTAHPGTGTGHPGGGEPPPPDHGEVTGKVDGLLFDHFGDFVGFILETERAEFHRFRSRELRVLDVVRRALDERRWITVVREHHDYVRNILFRSGPPL